MVFDPFKMSEGLIDDVDIFIDDFSFEFDPEYNKGDTLVGKAVISSDDDEVENGTELLFACGTGWTSNDQGATAEREDGKEKTFNNGSKMGLFAASCINVAEDVMRARYEADNDVTPMSGKMYIGLGFHVEIREYNYSGEIGKKNYLAATKFLGDRSDGAKPASSTTKKASAAKPKGKAKAKAEPEAGSSDGIDADVLKQLDAIADDCENHDEFMERAMAEVDPDAMTAEVEEAIADTSEDDPTTIWNRAIERAS